MIKKIGLTTAIIVVQNLLSYTAIGAEIDLTISGKGEVSVLESETSCSTNCEIINELDKSTLVATAESGYTFDGWSGQACSSGKGLNFSGVRNTLSGASGGAKTLRAADLNGDNSVDLVNISLFDGKITLMLNNGDATFLRETIDTDLHYPSSLDLYDWDNDGDHDLIVSVYGQGVIKIYNNDGLGGFSFNQDIAIQGVKPYAIAVEDINQDSQPDILISKFSSDISGDLFVLVNSISEADTSWYMNDGTNNFEAGKNISNTAAITLDTYLVEGSNKMMIAAAEIQSGDIALYSQENSSVNRKVINTGGGAYGVALGDADKDGYIDVLSAHYRPSRLKIVYGMGENEFSTSSTIVEPSEGVTATAFGDFNNDSYIDTATGEFNNKTFYYLATNGYKDCVVSQNETISLTANFKANENTGGSNNAGNNNVIADKVESKSSGGGGSMPTQLTLLIFLVICMRRLSTVN